MKVGDLVACNHPAYFTVGSTPQRMGVIVGRTNSALYNKSFKVLWRDGTIGNNVWDYDLKIVESS